MKAYSTRVRRRFARQPAEDQRGADRCSAARIGHAKRIGRGVASRVQALDRSGPVGLEHARMLVDLQPALGAQAADLDLDGVKRRVWSAAVADRVTGMKSAL